MLCRGGRWHEDREQASKEMRFDRIWWYPVREEHIPKTFGVKEVSHQQYTKQPGDMKQLVSAMTQPLKCKLSTKHFAHVVGGQQAKGWKTFTPQSACLQIMDLAVLRECHGHNRWLAISHSWLSVLLQERLLVRCKAGPGPWHFSLGHLQGQGALLWPATMQEINGKQLFRPSVECTGGSLHIGIVFNPDEWEVMPASWLSPLHCIALGAAPGVAAVAEGTPKPLMEVLAAGAFYNMTLCQVQDICKIYHMGLEGASMYDMLAALAQHFIPGLTETQLHSILSLRMKPEGTMLSDFFESEEVLACFDQQDQKEIVKHSEAKDRRATLQSSSQYKKKLHALYRSLPQGALAGAHLEPASSSSDRGAKRRKVKAKDVATARQYPAAFPSSCSLDEAQAMAPPGCRLSKDLNENRWRAYYKPFGNSISRSWPLHGEMHALRQVCKQAWAWHESITGEPCPIGGVMGSG